jgi:transposase
MKKLRRRYNREFKLSVITELEGGKSSVQIAREQGIHPSLPSRWRDEYAENPEKAFGGNGKPCKYEARIAELERMLGQLHAENELLKKSLCHVTEENPRGTDKTDTKRRYMTILVSYPRDFHYPHLELRSTVLVNRIKCSTEYVFGEIFC